MSNGQKVSLLDEAQVQSTRTWVTIAIMMGIGLGYAIKHTAAGAGIGVALGAVIAFIRSQMGKNK